MPYSSLNGDYPLAVLRVSRPHAGYNYRGLYTRWLPISGFIPNDGAIGVRTGGAADGDPDANTTVAAGTGWVYDAGDLTMDDAQKEPRFFCQRGRMSGTFTGTNLFVRAQIMSGWGRFAVYVDGAYCCTISCDAEDHGAFLESQMRDALVVDGLANTGHTVDIYAVNSIAGQGGFVSITGFKVMEPTVQDADFFVWNHDHIPTHGTDYKTPGFNEDYLLIRAPGSTSDRPPLNAFARSNKFTAGVLTRAVTRLQTATLPATLVNAATGTAITAQSLDGVAPNTLPLPTLDFGVAIPVRFVGVGITADTTAQLSVAYQYSDPNGAISSDTTYTVSAWPEPLPPNQASAAQGQPYTGTVDGWYADDSGPGGVRRIFNTKTAIMYFNGLPGISSATYSTTIPISNCVVTVMKDSGWGAGTAYIYGWNSSGARVLAGYIGSATGVITSADGVGGGFAYSYPGTIYTDATWVASAVPLRDFHIRIRGNTAAPLALLSVATTYGGQKWTAVTDTHTLQLKSKAVPPTFAPNPRIGPGGFVISDMPSRTTKDMSVPYDNANATHTVVRSRFPTYAVYYGPGNTELLAKYDLLIIEPTAVTRAQVAYWQSLGIKVLGYVSFGEEDGKRVDPFDLGSQVEGPAVDDGLGTGGYASYYNKMGNLCGESSECQHDRQRVEGVKACALLNPKYLTAPGRCSKACTKDWREGYITWEAGGACGGGFTKNDKWVRDAMTACSNATCSGYAPLNQKCTQWEEAEVKWGQDFQSTTTFPDQNGIWSSTFINPSVLRWREKLRDFYLPPVMDAGALHTETVTLVEHTGTVDGLRMVGRVTQYPIDDDDNIAVKSNDETITYVKNVDYSFDPVTGVFTMGLTTLVPGATTLPPTPVKITYMKKGLQCDGVFMDTVDTVDVYPSETFQQGMVDTIGFLKGIWPNKHFCSNRGFTVFERTVKFCSSIMFETFISDYNFVTGEYGMIDDPGAIEWNNNIKEQLRTLRETNTFDVFALNYAPNGPEGDEMRRIINEKCYTDGYLSWTSVISLQDPLPNEEFTLSIPGRLRTNIWSLRRTINIP